MKRLLTVVALSYSVSLFPMNSLAYTIYVDSANQGGTEDGTSWATAWGTISEGTSDLAATNAVEQGGHLVLVTNSGSTYAENVNLNSAIAGTGTGNRNTFRGLGHPEVNGSSYPFDIDGAQYVTIDGFNAVADSYAAFYIREDDVILKNCVAYDTNADRYGIDLSGAHRLQVENCTFWCLDSAIRVYTGYDDCSIKNSIIAGCGHGIYERYSYGSVSNCIFYGNGVDWYDNSGGYRLTETDMNSPAYAGNNIIANPGFRMGQSRYFNRFYTNNVAATHADDGGYAGAYKDPEITYYCISNVTWYVSPDGSDSYTTDQATNPATPWQTLSHAQSRAEAGATIIVKPGRYAEQVSFYKGGSYDATTSNNVPLTFRAEVSGCATVWSSWAMFDLENTLGVTLDGLVLDGEGNGTYGVYACAGAGNTFDNMTVTNLSVSTGAGFYLTGGGHVISNANIGPNSCDGINLYPGGVTILDSIIHDNVYGLEANGPNYIVAERTRFYDNDNGAWSDGQYTYGGNYVRYLNCAFYGNSIGVRSESPQASRYYYVYLLNCALYGNTTGAYCDGYGNIYAYNTVFSDNSSYGAREEQNAADGDFRSWNNCFWNNGINFYAENSTTVDEAGDIDTYAGGYSNIVSDPLFLDAANGDFQIVPFSPCVDAGKELTAVPDDFYGTERPQGGAYDIGLHEAGPMPPPGTFINFR